MMEILHVCVLFLIAVMTGMGVGSAGLLVLWLTMMTNISQRNAQGLNLGFFLAASVAAMLIHLNKRTLPWRDILICALLGAAGAWLGSLAAAAAPEIWLRRLFGTMMVIAGAMGLFRPGDKGEKFSEKNDKNLL